MNYEEISISLTIKTKKAEEEIKKLTPKISEQISKMQECMGKINLGKFIDNFKQAFLSIKKNFESLKNSDIGTQVALAINTEAVQNQVSQIEKEIDSLKNKIGGRHNRRMEFKWKW